MNRVRKQLPIPSMDGDPDNDRIWCNWDDCENPASYLHRMVVCHAAAPYRHAGSQICHLCEIKCFCSARCLDWWSHSHVPGQYGRSTAGINARFL